MVLLPAPEGAEKIITLLLMVHLAFTVCKSTKIVVLFLADLYSSPKMIFLLEVAVDNDVAINLYEKFGFKIIHTRKKYYGKKDAYVMERVIENE